MTKVIRSATKQVINRDLVLRRAASSAARARRRAFTLLELLVVVAMIALLISIVSPTFRRVRMVARSSQCADQMYKLGEAWTIYAWTGRGFLVGSNTGGSSYGTWVGPWGDMKNGLLYPYVGRPEIYQCPSSTRVNPQYPISYSMAGSMNGEGSRWTNIKGIPEPSRGLVLIEEDDWRGYNVNSWMLVGPNQWEDYVAGNHDQTDNLVFADGHVENWKWENPNTLSIPYHEAGFYMPDPGNQDLARLWKVWTCQQE